MSGTRFIGLFGRGGGDYGEYEPLLREHHREREEEKQRASEAEEKAKALELEAKRLEKAEKYKNSLTPKAWREREEAARKAGVDVEMMKWMEHYGSSYQFSLKMRR